MARSRFQFSLRGMFLITSLCALVAAMVAANGPLGAIFCAGAASCWMVIASFRRRSELLGVGGVVVLLASLGAVPLAPLTQFLNHSNEVCVQCGLLRNVTSEGTMADRSKAKIEEVYVDTPLSIWFGSHFGDDCTHEWEVVSSSGSHYNSIFGVRVMMVVGCAAGSRDQAVELEQHEMHQLDELFAANPQAARDSIVERLTTPRVGSGRNNRVFDRRAGNAAAGSRN